jgi:PAS domain S-box-containing protein
MNKYSGFKLLIVDDNERNLYSLRARIEKHLAVQVFEASSGQVALDLALNQPGIDLIILDVQMPGMDGFQTASMLKIRKRTQDIPIIFLTAAFNTEEFQKKGYDVGAVDYLLKPIDDNQLINKICSSFRLIEKERELNKILETKVTERTAELVREKRKIENIYQHMGEALLTLDLGGLIMSVNPAACRLLDYDNDALIGMKISDLFEEEEPDQAEAFFGTWLEALIMAGALERIGASLVAGDGRRVPILFSRTAQRDDDDEVCGIICIAKDMTGYVKEEKIHP